MVLAVVWTTPPHTHTHLILHGVKKRIFMQIYIHLYSSLLCIHVYHLLHMHMHTHHTTSHTHHHMHTPQCTLCTRVHTHTRTHHHTYTYTHSYTCTHTHTACTHTHAHTQTACTHTHTHTVVAMACGADLTQLSFLGMMAMWDPPREGVEQSIIRLKESGVSVKMITGDAQETAESIGGSIAPSKSSHLACLCVCREEGLRT